MGAHETYQRLVSARDPFLRRARWAAGLTVPALLPPDGSLSADLPAPAHNIGAVGVHMLSAKISLALFPPNIPFFRLVLPPEYDAALEGEAKTALQLALRRVEDIVMSEITRLGDRHVLEMALQHLVVAGNVLLEVTEDGLVLHPLDRYVVERDPTGRPKRVVIHAQVPPEDLPPDIRPPAERAVTVYTVYEWSGNRIETWQELRNGEEIPGTRGSYPADAPPVLALRWQVVPGENYGRGYVDDLIGHLESVHTLAVSIIEGTAVMAKRVYLKRPGSAVDAVELAEAENGAIVEGNPDDVVPLSAGNPTEFRVAYELLDQLVRQLSFAFLLTTSVQRDAERVTAEEVRLVAQELQDMLGGIYALLTPQLQVPYVRRRLAILRRKGVLPAALRDVEVSVVGGIAALGRGHDKAKLMSFLQSVAGTLGPDELARRINVSELLARIAVADGIDTAGLIKTDEELAAEQAQSAVAQMAQQAAPGLVAAMAQNGG